MQPLIFMDDLTRGTTTRNSAQARNIKLVCLMNTKQLSLHPDKTGFIIWKTCKSNIQCVGFTASKNKRINGWEIFFIKMGFNRSQHKRKNTPGKDSNI